nr:GNAT family N-acetyltransferase [uncultured Flavobacterium sp.]
MYRIERYTSDYFDQWNGFIATSKNGTFLFHRNFMEYHADRFTDYSLLVFQENKLVAVLPANVDGNTVYSHRGLTYGGLILPETITFEKVKEIFTCVLEFLDKEGIATLQIKQVPQMYYKSPAFETDYLFYAVKADLVRKDLNLAVDYRGDKWISKSKLKHYRRRSELGFVIKKGHEFKEFWEQALVPRLQSKHNASPVHTLKEIELLANRFPENIVQCNIYLNDVLMAGITLFISDGVVKSQYGATTDEGEKVRALDYLFISLLEEYRDSKLYFDMGTVMERDGTINMGLLKQKEELACSTYCQDIYEISTANFIRLS